MNILEQKHVLWVCCDIQKTYDSNDVKANEKRIKLFRSLDIIREKLGLNYVVFSFLSTMNCDELLHYCNSEEMNLYKLIESTNKTYNTNILQGVQMGCNGYLYGNKICSNLENQFSSKADMIIKQKKEMQQQGFGVENMIYIDDSPGINVQMLLMNQNILQEINEKTLNFSLIYNNEETLFLEDEFKEVINMYKCKSNISLDYVVEGIEYIIEDIDKKKGVIKGVSYEKSNRFYYNNKYNHYGHNIL